MLVPMTATIRPGPVTPDAGTDTWASTFATATGVPGRRPVQPAASAVSEPAREPIGAIDRDIFSSTTAARRGSSAAKKPCRESPPPRPDRLVASRAAVARLGARELPDDPVGGFDEPVGGAVHRRQFVEDLECLRIEPLR